MAGKWSNYGTPSGAITTPRKICKGWVRVNFLGEKRWIPTTT